MAEYLHAEGIQASFFCVGKFIARHPEILSQLDKLDHYIGNHTYSHPNLVTLFESRGKKGCIKELELTYNLIQNIIPDKPVHFRAPYGLWKPFLSILMNENLHQISNYRGPWFCDIGGNDYIFWDKEMSAEFCANSYLEEIENKKNGIVLMHDSTADFKNIRSNNRTFETIKILVPALKERGYTITGIDKLQIPEERN